jgi:hypothetical protein
MVRSCVLALVVLHGAGRLCAQDSEMRRILALEEDGEYGPATIEWNKYMKSIRSQVGQNPKVKTAYFEAYLYGTRTLFKYGLHDPAAKSKDRIIYFAAKRIVDLEFSKTRDGWDEVGPRFIQLLEAEPMLKEAYDREKKTRVQ